MGVTKQAAQKKFVPKASDDAPMDASQGFSRFTPRARNVVVALAVTGPTLDADAEQAPLIPFDAAARKALELTFREALRLGHDYVGTEHVLLALLENENGDGLLTSLGVTKARVEADLVAALDLS